MSKIHECVTVTKRRNITVQENGRRANFVNEPKSSYQITKVDGCLVKDGKKADWIVTKVGTGSVIVELKGKDIPRACEQLFTTLEHDSCAEWLEPKRALLIVCSRVPKFDSIIAKASVQARKKGVRLKAVCGGGDFEIEDLLPK